MQALCRWSQFLADFVLSLPCDLGITVHLFRFFCDISQSLPSTLCVGSSFTGLSESDRRCCLRIGEMMKWKIDWWLLPRILWVFFTTSWAIYCVFGRQFCCESNGCENVFFFTGARLFLYIRFPLPNSNLVQCFSRVVHCLRRDDCRRFLLFWNSDCGSILSHNVRTSTWELSFKFPGFFRCFFLPNLRFFPKG